MPWLEDALKTLIDHPVCGYQPQDAGATEPTALAALALAGYGQLQAAAPAAEFFAQLQASDGSVGVRKGEPIPRWPTSLVILAWLALNRTKYRPAITRCLKWALTVEGERMSNKGVGHDSTLAAWPWVEGTHSWMEPSALFTIAFKCCGMGTHARANEAVTLLIDRLLPEGGANYGNTYVLGQLLRPHLQPSGVTMLALRGETDVKDKLAHTLDYLAKSISTETTAASLAWALMGLAAHQRFPDNASEMLAAAYARTMKRDKSPHRIALLVLASLGPKAPLISMQPVKQ